MDRILLAQFFISQLGHFLRIGTEKRPARQACFLFIEYTEKNFLLSTFSSRNRSAMQTAFCPAEGVITLTAHPHPQKSAQTFTFQHRRIHALPSKDIHLRLGFIQKLRNRCYRGYWGFIELRIYSDRKPPCRSLYKVPAR